ncbi:MAG TPA: hypothetical protein VMM36_01420 [Opitutaceae bacterium]|nr:hypothetical protein [Opitutaceae bacterium]
MNASKTKTSVILALGLALVAIPGVSAGDASGKHSSKEMFKSMDADQDGKVTRAEHAAAAKKKFAEIDTDKDGSVTLAEMTAAHAKMRAGDSERSGTAATPGSTDQLAKAEKTAKASEDWIKKHDSNNDGKLSATEHNAASEAMFAKLDTNKDGTLSQEECEASGKTKS